MWDKAAVIILEGSKVVISIPDFTEVNVYIMISHQFA